MGQALFWAEELGKFIFVWVSWIGVSAGLKQKDHIQVKIFPNSLRNKGKYKAEAVVYIIIDLLWFLTSILVVIYGFSVVSGQYVAGVYGSATSVPMWLAYLCIPLSGVLVCLRLIGELVTYTDVLCNGKILKTRRSPEDEPKENKEVQHA
jgi:TRAP-type C4-dicarboxylate transport system permease small subunit